MASEGKLRDKLKARVEAYGGEIRAVSWLGRKNAPDVLALFAVLPYVLRPSVYPKGGNYWIETKGTEALSTAQAREHERMRAAGCVVVVARNEQELDAWLPPI